MYLIVGFSNHSTDNANYWFGGLDNLKERIHRIFNKFQDFAFCDGVFPDVNYDRGLLKIFIHRVRNYTRGRELG